MRPRSRTSRSQTAPCVLAASQRGCVCAPVPGHAASLIILSICRCSIYPPGSCRLLPSHYTANTRMTIALLTLCLRHFSETFTPGSAIRQSKAVYQIPLTGRSDLRRCKKHLLQCMQTLRSIARRTKKPAWHVTTGRFTYCFLKQGRRSRGHFPGP
jgi:hypothetical protein